MAISCIHLDKKYVYNICIVSIKELLYLFEFIKKYFKSEKINLFDIFITIVSLILYFYQIYEKGHGWGYVILPIISCRFGYIWGNMFIKKNKNLDVNFSQKLKNKKISNILKENFMSIKINAFDIFLIFLIIFIWILVIKYDMHMDNLKQLDLKKFENGFANSKEFLEHIERVSPTFYQRTYKAFLAATCWCIVILFYSRLMGKELAAKELEIELYPWFEEIVNKFKKYMFFYEE